MAAPRAAPRAAPVNPSWVNSCACEVQTAEIVSNPNNILFISSYRFDGMAQFLFASRPLPSHQQLTNIFPYRNLQANSLPCDANGLGHDQTLATRFAETG